MPDLNDWDIVGDNNQDPPPDGWPEGTMDYSDVNNTGREGMGVLARFWRDVNGSLSAGGIANAYTLTLNAGYSSYFAGMYFACVIPTTNTGASTINVNGIGVQDIVNKEGNALPANTLQAGGIFEFRYDGTNFQLMGTLGGGISVSNLDVTASDLVDLTDTGNALNVGAANPTLDPHLAVDRRSISAKGSATTRAELRLNPFGSFINAYNNGLLCYTTDGSGMVLRSSGDTDAENRSLRLTYQSSNTVRGLFGFDAAVDSGINLLLENRNHGGHVRLTGENSGGNRRLGVEFDPNVRVTLYDPQNNVPRFQTETAGRVNLLANDTGDNSISAIRYIKSDNTPRAELGFRTGADANFEVFNRQHGGLLRFYGETGSSHPTLPAGSTREMIRCDPDNHVLLIDTDTGSTALSTTDPAAGGILVNNTLTGGGVERVLTTSDLGVDEETGTFVASMSGFDSSPQNVTFRYRRVGNIVTMFPTGSTSAALDGTLVQSGASDLPASIRPSTAQFAHTIVEPTSGNYEHGSVQITTGGRVAFYPGADVSDTWNGLATGGILSGRVFTYCLD